MIGSITDHSTCVSPLRFALCFGLDATLSVIYLQEPLLRVSDYLRCHVGHELMKVAACCTHPLDYMRVYVGGSLEKMSPRHS